MTTPLLPASPLKETANINLIVANAIYSLIKQDIAGSAAEEKGRFFFRVDGFDDEVYRPLLDIFKAEPTINIKDVEREVEVHTVEPIASPGYEQFNIDLTLTATYYRNRLPEGKILVLLFPDNPPSDAQSLADLHTITESRLVKEGLPLLIDSASEVSKVYLDDDLDKTILQNFINSWSRGLPTPSLRVLTSFIDSVIYYVREFRNKEVEIDEPNMAFAITQALPALDLFRVKELSARIAKVEGELSLSDLKKLKEVAEAGQLGAQPLELDEINRYRRQINKVLSGKPYQSIILNFIERGYEGQNKEALEQDWEDVKEVFGKKAKVDPTQQLRNLADQILNVLGLEIDGLESEPESRLSAAGKETLQSLLDATELEYESVEEFIEEYKGVLPKPLQRKIRKLVVQVPVQKGSDFVLLVITQCIKLILDADPLRNSSEAKVQEKPRFNIKLKANKVENFDKIETRRAVHAFRALYGGIEDIWDTIEWNLSEIQTKATAVSLDETAPEVQENLEEESTEENVTSGFGTIDTLLDMEPLKVVTLTFKVEITDILGNGKSSGEIHWTYNPQSALSSFANALCYEETTASLIEAVNPNRPFYLNNPGWWYGKNYRTKLSKALTESFNGYKISADSKQNLLNLVEKLEESNLELGREARLKGLGRAYPIFNKIISNYQALLDAVLKIYQTESSRNIGLPLISSLWVVKGREWAVVTPLHPLKLLTYYNRWTYFNNCLKRLMLAKNPHKVVAANKIFIRELDTLTNSSNFPILLSLNNTANNDTNYFVPHHEDFYFEVYLPQNKVAGDIGLELTSEAKEDERAVDLIAHTVHEYLDTYPFSEKGLQLTVTNCSSGDFPISFIEALYKQEQKSDRSLAVDLMVHAATNGALIYQEMSNWLEKNGYGQANLQENYLPGLTVSVVEAPLTSLGEALNSRNSGLAVLTNVFSGNTDIKGKLSKPGLIKAGELSAFLPSFQTRMKAAQQDNLQRDLELNQLVEPKLVRDFNAAQYYSMNISEELEDGKVSLFSRKINILKWKETLLKLHSQFNWVICYDQNTDRRLLQNVCGSENISVIKYTSGLGPKRQHNLTASSSKIALRAVRQRLLAKLENLIPTLARDKRDLLADWLLQEAQKISGDLILRATGPGTYVNELIGVVLTKYILDKELAPSFQEDNHVRFWLSADEYRHWFEATTNKDSKSRPDLIGFDLIVEADQMLRIDVIVAEAKYISGESYEQTHKTAAAQVKTGVETLERAFQPGNPFLDSTYWYDQLYRATVAQVELNTSQQDSITPLLPKLYKGDFTLNIQGQACIFSYNSSPAEIDTEKGEEEVINVESKEENEDGEKYEDEYTNAPRFTRIYAPQKLATLIKDILGLTEELTISQDSLPEEEELKEYKATNDDLIEYWDRFEQTINQNQGDLDVFFEDTVDYLEEDNVEDFVNVNMDSENFLELSLKKQLEEVTIFGQSLTSTADISSSSNGQTKMASNDSSSSTHQDQRLSGEAQVGVGYQKIEDTSSGSGANVLANQFHPLPEGTQNLGNVSRSRFEDLDGRLVEPSSVLPSLEQFGSNHTQHPNFPREFSKEPSLWTPPGVMPHRDFLKNLNDYLISGEDDKAGEVQAREASLEIQRVFKVKGIQASIKEPVIGPRVIRIRVEPKLSSKDYNRQIQSSGDLLKQRLGLTLEPQIETGSDKTIWIDIARKSAVTIGLGSLLKNPIVNQIGAGTRFPIGMSLEGVTEWGDLSKTAHWLIGGTSGSGKSIFLRSVLLSLLYNNSPETLKLILIDPKADMAAFQDLPFVTNYVMGTERAEDVAELLNNLHSDMQSRISNMTQTWKTNDLDQFHKMEGRIIYPRVVIILEEYATLLDSTEKTKKEIEMQVRRLSATGRSSGYHLFICTQNPLSSVLGSSLKSNLSGRVALKVQSKDNSQVILDRPGAEKLLKNGDMYYLTEGAEMKRLQAPFVTEEELFHTLETLSKFYKR